MKASVGKCVFLSALVLGMLSPGLVTAKTTYPEGLEFLSRYSAPRFYFAQGAIEEVDTAGVALSKMPFRFYWEKGDYFLDIRSTGGSPKVFIRKVGDTIWSYDFITSTEIVMLLYQDFPWLTQLRFNPKYILPIFNIFPGGFPAVDSFSSKGSTVTVTTEDGLTYELNPDAKEITALIRDAMVVSCLDFEEQRGVMWPHEISLSPGMTTGPTRKLTLVITKWSFSRQPEERALFYIPVPYQLKNTHDVRP